MVGAWSYKLVEVILSYLWSRLKMLVILSRDCIYIEYLFNNVIFYVCLKEMSANIFRNSPRIVNFAKV